MDRPAILAELRTRIDALDDRLLALLNERARLVEEVGKAKQGWSGPFYVPSRERAIVERLVAANPGPFPSHALKPVFQEIFSACLSLEKGLRVAYLGPEGTFTHQATKHQFGLSAQGLPVGTIAAVFAEVEKGQADFGVVPVENASEGAVIPTLDTFLETSLRISAEIVLPISHCLVARHGLELAGIQRVYSHPQALGQCRGWLHANLPEADRIEASSTSEAARLAREDAAGAAVASELAAELHDLAVLRRKLEDMPQNATRFLVVGRQQAQPTGNDRTSLVLTVADGPGRLLHLLQPFAEAGLNLTKIESRPSRRKPWECAFFLDLDGHEQDAPVARALEAVSAHVASLKVLGSYPKAPLAGE